MLLLKGASIDVIDRDGDTAKKFAHDNGHTEVLKLLEDQSAKKTSPETSSWGSKPLTGTANDWPVRPHRHCILKQAAGDLFQKVD